MTCDRLPIISITCPVRVIETIKLQAVALVKLKTIMNRYLNNLLQACQCSSVRAERNWLSLFTKKAMSSLVKVTYCKAPMMLLY